jgi:hypothetical protein
MPEQPSLQLDATLERDLAGSLYNYTWVLMERTDRSAGEDDEMVHAAHASAYHWMTVGEPRHHCRGEWLCARVYTLVGRAEPALHHARRCLALCEEHAAGLADWDLPYAHEALARAYAVAGDADRVAEHRAAAEALLADVADPQDREQLERDLASL